MTGLGRTIRWWLLVTGSGLSLLCELGCVSSSIDADVRRVHDLTRVEDIPRAVDTDVDPVSADDARRLLAQPLEPDTAVRVALLNNRELRATLREMGIARGRLIQAGLLPNPRAGAELLPERNTQLELRVEYDITSAVLAPMRAHAAAPELEAARYRAAAAVVDLGYRVRIAFYRLQSAEQRLAVAQQVLDGSAASRDAARAMLEAGNVAALDVASQEAAYERGRITVAKLELEVATERERVERLIGAYGEDTKWRVQAELPAVPEHLNVGDNVETRALRASLELRQTRQHLEGLARRAGVTRTAGWLPDIALDVHGLHGSPADSALAASGRNWRLGGGASVGVPLFDRNQGTATALEAEFDALLERYYGMAVDIRSAAREASGRVASSHARARQYKETIVPAQQRVTEQTLLQYNAMQLGVFQLLEARREQLDVQLAYVETLREYWSSVAELDALLAGKRVTLDAGGATKPADAQADSVEGH